MTTQRLTFLETAILTNIDADSIRSVRTYLHNVTREVRIIYHKDCLDGTVASFVAWLMIDGVIAPTSMSYQDAFPYESLEPNLTYTFLFVDFCLPVEDLKRLAGMGHEVIVVDHHASAIDKIMAVPREETNFWYFLASENLAVIDDQKHSGASLTTKFYDYIDALNPPMCDDAGLMHLVTLAREHDLWLHKGDPSTDAMALAYWHKHKSFEDLSLIWQATHLTVEAVDAMVAEGRVHLDKAVNEIKEVIKCGCRVEIGGYQAWLFYCERAYTSLAGSIVNKYFDIALSFYRDGDKFKMSIRTSEDSHVSAAKLAEAFGGGGHERAAGFYTDTYPAVLLASKSYHGSSERAFLDAPSYPDQA